MDTHTLRFKVINRDERSLRKALAKFGIELLSLETGTWSRDIGYDWNEDIIESHEQALVAHVQGNMGRRKLGRQCHLALKNCKGGPCSK